MPRKWMFWFGIVLLASLVPMIGALAGCGGSQGQAGSSQAGADEGQPVTPSSFRASSPGAAMAMAKAKAEAEAQKSAFFPGPITDDFYGMTKAEVIRRFGEPDEINERPLGGGIHWIYRNGDEELTFLLSKITDVEVLSVCWMVPGLAVSQVVPDSVLGQELNAPHILGRNGQYFSLYFRSERDRSITGHKRYTTFLVMRVPPGRVTEELNVQKGIREPRLKNWKDLSVVGYAQSEMGGRVLLDRKLPELLRNPRPVVLVD